MHAVGAVKVVEHGSERNEQDRMQRQPAEANRRAARFFVDHGQGGIAAHVDEKRQRDCKRDGEAESEMLDDPHRRGESPRGLRRLEVDEGVEVELLGEEGDGEDARAYREAHPRARFFSAAVARGEVGSNALTARSLDCTPSYP